MKFEEFLEQRKVCSKSCKTAGIENCCECAFKMAKKPEWEHGNLPPNRSVVCLKVSGSETLEYAIVGKKDPMPAENIKGWYEIPEIE